MMVIQMSSFFWG